MTDFTGQKLGRYLIEEKLGEGGMAVVYRAADERLGRSVAVKVIRVEVFPTASLEGMLKRFDREARALASLTHANIVGVIDYGEVNGAPYLVMEYLPGGCLKDRMGAPMAFVPAARTAIAVAGALDYAHARGIIHRDVKPTNILLTATGDPMLTDFGIAKLLELNEGSTALTSSGMAIGTPEYMAPEQWMGKSGPASDQYALGLILYELVTGRKPYTSATPGELLLKQATEPVPPPRTFARDLPGRAEDVILRALARAPEDRYPSMKAFAAALEEAIHEGQTKSATLWPPATRIDFPPSGEERPASPSSAPPPAERVATPPPGTPREAPLQEPSRRESSQRDASTGTPPPPAGHASTPPPASYTPPPQRTPSPVGAPPPTTPPPMRRDATPPPVSRSAPGIGTTPPPASYTPPPVGAPARSNTPISGGTGPYPAPAPAPTARRLPTGLMVGGLAAGLALVALVVIGLIFIAGRGALNRRAAQAATQAALVQPAQPTQPAATQIAPTQPAPAGPTEAPVVPVEVGPHTGTLRVNFDSYPEILDPQRASYVNETAHVHLIYEGLTRLNEKLETVPGAAARWEYSADLRQLRFTLRKDLQYSDGSPLNARRFEYAILRNLDPAMGGDYSTVTDEITGAVAYRTADPAKTPVEELRRLRAGVGVRALDLAGQPCRDYDQPECLVLELDFTRPAPYFHTVMSLWVSYPAKEELIQRGGERWFEDPANQVGNGPMVLNELEAGQRALFRPNLRYWRGQARIDVEARYISGAEEAVQAFRSGDLDVVTLSAEHLPITQQDPALANQTLVYPGSCTYMFQFHQLKPPFDDKVVREAFSHLMDREALVGEVLKGYGSPTQTWIPKGFPGYDAGENRYPFDPAMARSILMNAGYTIANGQLSRGGKPIPITLTYIENQRNQVRYEWIAGQWKAALGLAVKLNPVEAAEYARLAKDPATAPQTNLVGWCADYPDPQNWLSMYWQSGSLFSQRIGFKDAELDQMLEKADMESDPARRMDIYSQAQKRLVDDIPGVFLWNNVNAFLVKPYVKGFQATPLDTGWPGDLDPLSVTIEK